MDKTFNFFKSKAKKENQRPRNNSNKSNSSKASSKQSCRVKPVVKPPAPLVLSKKEKQIREAIDLRFQKSKLKTYVFSRRNEQTHRRSVSSHSSDYEQFKRLRKMGVVDLKEYHRQQESVPSDHSNSSSQEKKRFNLKFKLKDKATPSNIVKTEGNELDLRIPSSHDIKALSKDMKTTLSKEMKTLTPNKVSKKADQWKFISIQLKEDLSKPKTRKTQVKINSHRSYNVQEKAPKMKPNHSMHKYLDKPSKVKGLNPDKLAKTRF